ncbi:hypothetical protein B0H11DRAFT_1926785 [Mycena galericulata]|nr:hypothetical protein B0H11DRAFT_1926785 [Mycena galericulata]
MDAYICGAALRLANGHAHSEPQPDLTYYGLESPPAPEASITVSGYRYYGQAGGNTHLKTKQTKETRRRLARRKLRYWGDAIDRGLGREWRRLGSMVRGEEIRRRMTGRRVRATNTGNALKRRGWRAHLHWSLVWRDDDGNARLRTPSYPRRPAPFEYSISVGQQLDIDPLVASHADKYERRAAAETRTETRTSIDPSCNPSPPPIPFIPVSLMIN